MPLPLLVLALSAFAIGTTEFVIMGLLPEVAADLGVSIPGAGWLVTGYALGVALGAPFMALVTANWPRKLALLGLITGGAIIYWFSGASMQAVTTGPYRAVEFIKENIRWWAVADQFSSFPS